MNWPLNSYVHTFPLSKVEKRKRLGKEQAPRARASGWPTDRGNAYPQRHHVSDVDLVDLFLGH